MNLLGIDIGSSSVKCGLLTSEKKPSKIVHVKYAADVDGPQVTVQPAVLLKAISDAIHGAGPLAKRADAIALSVFSPGWVAMDGKGKPLTPIVTHQDRRSVAEAQALEARVGVDRYYRLAGARPFPGGISSSTWSWFNHHAPGALKRADLVGHLNTFLHRQWTGARVIDTANACFMGLYSTGDFGGWSDELCEAVGADRALLPDIRDANEIGGRLTASAARSLGLTQGMPVGVGVVDGSCGMLLAGARPGQLLNVCGSTDVLALSTDRYAPHPRLLTRPLGVGRSWLSVSTIAAAGSAIEWAHRELFSDLTWPAFSRLALKIAEGKPVAGAPRKKRKTAPPSSIVCEPWLAGDRMSIEQKKASFTGLSLATTRADILEALLDALAQASAQRLELLRATGVKIGRRVFVTGGAGALGGVFHRDWPGKWSFHGEGEATLRGLWSLRPR